MSATTPEGERQIRTFESAEVWKPGDVECLGTVHEVREIETGDVIANNDVRVDFLYEFLPCRQHLLFFLERKDLGTHNMRA